MDEIDWIKSMKKAFAIISLIFMGLPLFALVTLPINILMLGRYDNIMLHFVVVLFLIGIPPVFLAGVGYISLYIIETVKRSGKKITSINKNYIRDLPQHYSPALSSLIYDLKIDVYKDYTATILYLCTKKYINIKKNTNYEFTLGQQKDCSKLGKCEKYVLSVLLEQRCFDEEQFKQEIINEAKENSLIANGQSTHRTLINIILLILLIFLGYIFIHKKTIIWLLLFSIFGGIIIASFLYTYMQKIFNVYDNIRENEYKRTKKGEDLAIKLNGIKNYIKEYTLIKEKEIDYISILEDFIPYALVLDEANAIEEFIKHNAEYRNLIYNKNIYPRH